MAVKYFDKELTFKGGIHPSYKKELTNSKPIVGCPVPDKIVIPLQQHTGACCNASVAKGDEIVTGQMIGQAQGLHAPVHSSVCGKVAIVEPRLTANGNKIPSVVIDVDKEKTNKHVLKPLSDKTSIDDLIKRVKEAGIAGMGGATFPTHIKLSPPKEKKIDTVIINGCECEPYLTCDHRQMLENADELIDGLKLIMKIVGAPKGLIGIETNKTDCITSLAEKTKSDNTIEIVAVETKYPQGSEKQLIEALTSRQVPSGGLPSDVGCVVQNVGTAIAVSGAIRKGEALTERVVTVSGEGIKEPKNLRVKIGTPIGFVIEQAGGVSVNRGKVIVGGPMTGTTQHSFDAPVTKGTSGILVLPYEKDENNPHDPCIRCARCIDACPMGLMPNQLSVLSELDYYDKTEEYSVFDCIECGCCSYVCPSKRPIINHIRLAKYKLKQ